MSPTAEFQCSLIQPLGILPSPPAWRVNASEQWMPLFRGQGSKLRLLFSSDKWARQDISTETQPKPLEEQTLMPSVFPLGLLRFGRTPRTRGIFSSYSSCLPTKADQIPAYLSQTWSASPPPPDTLADQKQAIKTQTERSQRSFRWESLTRLLGDKKYCRILHECDRLKHHL